MAPKQKKKRKNWYIVLIAGSSPKFSALQTKPQ